MGPLARRRLGVALALCALLPTGACAGRNDAVQRELEALRRELAAMRAAGMTPAGPGAEARPPGAAPRLPAPPVPGARPAADPLAPPAPVASGPYGVTPPAGPPAARAPDPGAPPPLPVVKLKPRTPRPFAASEEPPIRIGAGGREAPPAARHREGPLEYDHIDEYGNLVDREGRIVYRAGETSPPIDTVAEEDPDWRVYEDPHESPAAKVARAVRVPKVLKPGERTPYEDAPPAPGVRDLGDGTLEAPPVGTHPVAAPRLRQVVVGAPEGSIPDDLDQSIRVDAPRDRFADDDLPVHVSPPAARPDAARPAPSPMPDFGGPPEAGAPEGDLADPDEPPVVVAPPEAPEPAPAEPSSPPAAEEAPPTAPIAVPEPVAAAPGPRKVIGQRVYRGAKERKVKALYDAGMKALNAGDHPAARKQFEIILQRYSDHDLADNALYWLAETAYAEGRWRQALAWFQDVVLRYPEGNKLPDAMLKSALCYARLGDASYAMQILAEVETLFASEPVAAVARERRQALAEGDSP